MIHVRLRHFLAAALGLAFTAAVASPPAQAGNWLTKGGTPLRQSANGDPSGFSSAQEVWSAANLGQSATQPVVVGSDIYHLAGPYLWHIQTSTTGEIVNGPTPLGDPTARRVNVFGTGTPLISQSSPSYSSETGVLYFGTAYGWVWSYLTGTKQFKHVELATGCPIVGSPLILKVGESEVVVIADRPNYPSETASPLPGQPLCPRDYGKVWVVWNLDQPGMMPERATYDAPLTKATKDGFGGFVTPSAVPGAENHGGTTFTIGADGFEGGRAIQLKVTPVDDRFVITTVFAVDSSTSGFAGNFTSDGDNAYWLDTKGFLWGVNLTTGHYPPGWPGHKLNLPAMAGLSAAFTNTEPAVVKTGDGTYLYVTLRNQTKPGQSGLRDGPTGSNGALLAIGPGGTLLWHKEFPDANAPGNKRTSINTAPLAITSQGSLLFGDVNGKLYSYAMASANVAGGDPKPFLVPESDQTPTAITNLLKPGELPAVGPFNFSQVSGVGVDPVMANGLILVGVNYREAGQDQGRLVAYKLGDGFDLAWQEAPQPLLLSETKPTSLTNQVSLAQTTRSYADLCPDNPVTVSWYLVDAAGTLIDAIATTTLDPGPAPDQPAPLPLSLTLKPTDPDEGQVVGIINHAELLAVSAEHPVNPALQLARSLGAGAEVQALRSCPGLAGEVSQRAGTSDPEGGLANNVIRYPYTKKANQDDPFVADLLHDKVALGPDFMAYLNLGYVNNLGLEAVDVRAKVWLRSDPADPGLGVPSVTVTVEKGCCDPFPVPFTKIPEGRYQIIAEIEYEGDTNPDNNRLVHWIDVVYASGNDATGPGSGLSD